MMNSRADTHVHTKYSGIGRLGFLRFPESISEPKDVVKNAHSLGLNVVCITDHNTLEGAFKAKEFEDEFPGTEVVIGEEISTLDGEIIGLYLNERVPRDLPAEETVDLIRDQGGLAVAPHPFSLHCPSLGEKIESLDLDAIEVLNAGHIDGYANSKALELGSDERWAKLGGSDSHAINTLAYAHTLFEGESAEDLRRSIKNRTTDAKGSRMPLEMWINWSIDVVLASDVLILKSIFGLVKEVDMHDPIVSKIDVMKTGKKVMALLGSVAYLLPPIPFLCGWTGKRLLKKLASNGQSLVRK